MYNNESDQYLFGNVFFIFLKLGDIALMTTTADKPPKYPLTPNYIIRLVRYVKDFLWFVMTYEDDVFKDQQQNRNV
jgi:hypothetical protein